MNENSRYILLIGGAIVLMALGFWSAYAWQQRHHITRDSALPEAQQMFEAQLQEQINQPATVDSVCVDTKQAVQDSLAQQRKAQVAARRAIRQDAEKEGYLWQQALSEYRFREPAEMCLDRMKEHGERVRDSLAGVYVAHEIKDSLLSLFDNELDAWHVRLLQQVIMLPTAKQALEAQQITQDEYNRIVAPVGKKNGK